jgi:hypothetical protein
MNERSLSSTILTVLCTLLIATVQGVRNNGDRTEDCLYSQMIVPCAEHNGLMPSSFSVFLAVSMIAFTVPSRGKFSPEPMANSHPFPISTRTSLELNLLASCSNCSIVSLILLNGIKIAKLSPSYGTIRAELHVKESYI